MAHEWREGLGRLAVGGLGLALLAGCASDAALGDTDAQAAEGGRASASGARARGGSAGAAGKEWHSGALGGASGAGDNDTAGTSGAGDGAPRTSSIADVTGISGLTFEVLPSCTVKVADAELSAAAIWEPLEESGCSDWAFHFREGPSGGLELVLLGNETFSSTPLERIGERFRMSGAAARGPVNGDTSFADGDLLLRTRMIWDSLVGRVPELWAKNLDFMFEDRDGDDQADFLLIEGEGVYEDAHDDYSQVYAARYRLKAELDTTPPTLREQRPSPFGFAQFSTSEPLAAGSSAELWFGEHALPLRNIEQIGIITGFEATELLQPGAHGTLRVLGSDLAGNGLDASVSVRVDALPEVTSPDFEQDGALYSVMDYPNCLANEASAPRESYRGLPPLEGSHSLLVAPGRSVGFYLARPAESTRLRLRVRPLADQPAVFSPRSLSVTASVSGGRDPVVVQPSLDFPEPEEAPAGSVLLQEGSFYGSYAFYALAERELVLELEEPGDLVRVVVDAPCAEGSLYFRTGAWLDDIRF